MTFIETVPEEGAPPDVAAMYETDRATLGGGQVPNLTRAFSLRPGVYAAWRKLNGEIKAGMDLRRYELAKVTPVRSNSTVWTPSSSRSRSDCSRRPATARSTSPLIATTASGPWPRTDHDASPALVRSLAAGTRLASRIKPTLAPLERTSHQAACIGVGYERPPVWVRTAGQGA